MHRVLLILAACAAGGAAVSAASAQRLPQAPRCPILRSTNHFNQRIDALPVAANSSTLIGSIGADATAKADFGSGLYEGGRNAGGDRHVIVVDRDRCTLYELFDAHPLDGGKRWRAGSGAIFDLRSNRLRPKGWTSADAAGRPILPGLARYGDVAKGSIDHALRFTARRTRRAYVYPARHLASSDSDPALPPMGMRVRLKRGADLSGLGPQARTVARALQRYGAILADNGSPWFFSGAPDSRWDNDDLQTLRRLGGSDFEVVDTRRLARPR